MKRFVLLCVMFCFACAPELSEPMKLYQTAQSMYQAKQYEEAIQAYHSLASEYPQETFARVEEGALLVQLGRWPDAILAVQNALEERPLGWNVKDLIQDKRFLPLIQIKTYQSLIEHFQELQNTDAYKTQIRIERMHREMREEHRKHQLMLHRISWMLYGVIFVLLLLIFERFKKIRLQSKSNMPQKVTPVMLGTENTTPDAQRVIH